MSDGRIPGHIAGLFRMPDKFREGPDTLPEQYQPGSNRLYPEVAPEDSKRLELCGHMPGRGAE